MDTKSGWKYVLLGVGALLVVMVIVYLRVSTYFHIPLVSLLPSTPLTQSVPIVSPTPRVKPTSVEKVTFGNGQYYFEIRGKFAAKPYYQDDILRGEFIINEDPYGLRIPVIMTVKTGTINVGRSKGSFSGTTVWKLEDTEALRLAIKPGEPARLRIQFFSSVLSKQEKLVKATLEGIMNGNWNIPKEFVFNPMMVGVVE